MKSQPVARPGRKTSPKAAQQRGKGLMQALNEAAGTSDRPGSKPPRPWSSQGRR